MCAPEPDLQHFKLTEISFIGLGAMGYLMASHLTKHFSQVLVYNRTDQVALNHQAEFGSRRASLKQALGASVIISCLPTTDVVLELIEANLKHLGNPLVPYEADTDTGSLTDQTATEPKAKPIRQIWVDCTSGHPDQATTIADLLDTRGITYLDAPVSGQTSGAKAGTLTMMVGGDPHALGQVKPVLETMSALIEHVGATGAGFSVKAINNLIMAANLWSCFEGLGVLKKTGIDLSAALRCINASSGQSLASSALIPARVMTREFPNTFALDLLAKDARIALELAQKTNSPFDQLSQITQILQIASADHTPGSADFSKLALWFEAQLGAELKA